MFSRRNKNLSTWRNKAALLLLVLASSFIINVATPRPAYAQWTTFDIPQIASNVWTQVKEAAKWAWNRGSAIAFRNAIKTFTQQLAYNAAVQLSSGGQGQTPLFSMQSIGEAAKRAGDDAMADALDSLISDPKSGFGKFNVCEPTGPNAPYLRLMVAMPLFSEFDNQPRKPKCTLANMKDSWDKVLNDPKYRKNFTQNFAPQLDPNQNNLGVGLSIQQNILKEKEQKAQNEKDEQQKNQGYLPITESITGFIKTPAPTLKNAQDVSWSTMAAEPLVQTTDIVADALGVFTNTFAARMMKKLQQGVIESPSRIMSGRFGSISGFGPIGGVEYATQTSTSISMPDIKGGEKIDVISDFSNCPEDVAFAPINNCTIDSSFERALRLADEGTPLTVQEAIDKGLIHGDWIFKNIRVLTSSRTPDAWYISDLKKLRKARIIPIGWELAAEKAITEGDTLQEIIGKKSDNYATGFNGFGTDGVCGSADIKTDGESPYCGLVNPDWILKAPPSQCRLLAYGQQLEFEGSNRQKTCVDVQNCVAEKADGSCQAWGYCTREKNIWRMSGDSCEFPENSGYSPYASCQAYTNTATDHTVAYLKDYLQGLSNGICDVSNSSCRWYSTSFNVNAGANSPDRYIYNGTQTNVNTTDISIVPTSTIPQLYLKKVNDDFSCSSNAEGCHKFFRLNNIKVSGLGEPYETEDALPVKKLVDYAVAKGDASTYSSFTSSTKTEAGVKVLSLREAPAYLGCYNNDGSSRLYCNGGVANGVECVNPLTSAACVRGGGGCAEKSECNNYMAACALQEVGCDLYTPTDRSPALPAIADATNVCPLECVSYNTYRQMPSDFQSRPINGLDFQFIPAKAQQCIKEDVGCDEFTNLEANERREYFSYLKQCVKPGNGEHTYYTWVGSDVTGYQLKTWELVATDPANPASPPKTTDLSLDCRPDGTTFPTTNADCKQFYNSTGTVDYRYASKTITASDQCVKYRKTADEADAVQQDNCGASGGDWVDGACFYQAIPTEGTTCSAQNVGCREYHGPTAENIKNIFTSTFGNTSSPDTSAAEGWSGGVVSLESTIFGGRSYKDNSAGLVKKNITVKAGDYSQYKYIVQLWAKQGDSPSTLTVTLKNSDGSQNVPLASTSSTLNNDWKIYEFGPAQVNFDIASLEIGGTTGGFYIDSVVLKQIQDTYYLRKNTWVMPKDGTGANICTDGTPVSGVTTPNYLGCRAYTNKSRERVARTGFAKLCREKAVGCEALVDTRNTTGPKAESIDMGDGRTITIPADQVVYRVYDSRKQCSDTDLACTRVGEPVLSSSGAVTKWADKFVKLNPEGQGGFIGTDGKWNFSSVMCKSTEDRCTEFKDDNNSSYFFKDPGDQACEYKKLDPLSGYGWYKKGTSEECGDLLFPSTGGFEDDDDSWVRYEVGDGTGILDATTYPTTVRTGKFSMKLVKGTRVTQDGVERDANSSIMQWLPSQSKQKYTIKAGVTYSAKVWFKTDLSPIPDNFRAVMYFGNAKFSPDPLADGILVDKVVTNQWQPLELSFTPKADGTAAVPYGLWIYTSKNQGGNTGDYIYFDDARVVPTTAYLCPKEQSGCTEFKEPGLTKQSYYYIKNDKLGSGEKCTGASETQGCLLFNDTSNPNVNWSSADTYAASHAENNKLVSPVSTGALDSNTLIKVRRDRVCGEWLSCMSEATRFVGKTPRNICYALGRCDRWGDDGVGKCGNWLPEDTNPKVLNETVYRERIEGGSSSAKFDWGDKDYSGYSIPGIYPINDLAQKNYADQGKPADIKLTHLDAVSQGGKIVVTDMGIDGSGNKNLSKICRVYPEADSPFPGERGIVKIWDTPCRKSDGTKCDYSGQVEVPVGKEMEYKDANACQQGQKNNCECSYQRASYTQGETLFYDFDSSDIPQVIPIDVGTFDDTKPINTKLKKKDYLIGLRGYCLEKDMSRVINANEATSNACLTWLPIDTVSGDISIYDFNPEAGFQGSAYYCSEAGGNRLVDDASTYATSNMYQPISLVNSQFVFRGSTGNYSTHKYDPSSVYWWIDGIADSGGKREEITVSDSYFYGGVDDNLGISFGLSDALRAMGGKEAIAGIVIKGAQLDGTYNNCFLHTGPATSLSAKYCHRFYLNRTTSSVPEDDGKITASVNWDPLLDIPNGITQAEASRYYNNFINIFIKDGDAGAHNFSFYIEFILYNSCKKVVQVADGFVNKAYTDNLLRRTDLQVSPFSPNDDPAKTGLGFTSARKPAYYGYMPNPPTATQNPLVITDKPGEVKSEGGEGNTGITYDTTSSPYSCTTFGCYPYTNTQPGVCVKGKNYWGCTISSDCDGDTPGSGVCSGYFSGVCMNASNNPIEGTSCITSKDCATGSLCGNYRSLAVDANGNGINTITSQLFARINDRYNRQDRTWVSEKFSEDKSGDYGSPPVIKQVNFSSTDRTAQEGNYGFTIVTPSGVVNSGETSAKAPAPVSAIFYAYNPNGQQMPLTDVYVDWGDNTTSGGTGKYKNHKHMCEVASACSVGVQNPGFESATGGSRNPDGWGWWEADPNYGGQVAGIKHTGKFGLNIVEGDPIPDPSAATGNCSNAPFNVCSNQAECAGGTCDKYRDAASLIGTSIGKLKPGVTYKITAWYASQGEEYSDENKGPYGAMYVGDNRWEAGFNNNFATVEKPAYYYWQPLELIFTPVREGDFTLDLYARDHNRHGATDPNKASLVYDDVSITVLNQSCKVDNDCSATVITPTVSKCDINSRYNFGDTPQACVQDSSGGEGYFTFTHVYTTASSTPYRPRVFVKDNWDWCTGKSGKGAYNTNCLGPTETDPDKAGLYISPISITIKP